MKRMMVYKVWHWTIWWHHVLMSHCFRTTIFYSVSSFEGVPVHGPSLYSRSWGNHLFAVFVLCDYDWTPWQWYVIMFLFWCLRRCRGEMRMGENIDMLKRWGLNNTPCVCSSISLAKYTGCIQELPSSSASSSHHRSLIDRQCNVGSIDDPAREKPSSFSHRPFTCRPVDSLPVRCSAPAGRQSLLESAVWRRLQADEGFPTASEARSVLQRWALWRS